MTAVDTPELPAQPEPPRQKIAPAASVPRETRTDGSAISEAVNEVMGIVDSLKQALIQMEDVLELVEHAERQKLADEHEIDSLRRLLRQLQQPRGGRGDRREHET